MGAMLGIISLLTPKPGICGLPVALTPLLSGTSFCASHSLIPCAKPKHHLAKQSRQISKPRGLWEAKRPLPVSLCPGVCCAFDTPLPPHCKKPIEIHAAPSHPTLYCAYCSRMISVIIWILRDHPSPMCDMHHLRAQTPLPLCLAQIMSPDMVGQILL